ncbi:MAG: CRISPR-associated endoribonuclease Cas6 [Balneola sp.]
MRLHLTLTPNTELVPFNYQHQLTGALHKWLGQNDLHDKISLYSFSWLRGKAERVEGGLNFPNGAKWFISFWEDEHTKKLKDGILKEPEVIFGMKVDKIKEQNIPEFGNDYRFTVASPVLVRANQDDGSRKHILYNEKEADRILTKRMKAKLQAANLSSGDSDISISFDRSYPNPQTKLVDIKGTKLRTSVCPVKIEGAPQAVKFAWTVGVGELTGSGFGAID